MKLAKSLLLGSAAGLVAVAGASAADLGVKKPSAVEYVKTCPTYGAGFFVVPGTTSCLKLIGRVRADYTFMHSSRANDKNVFRARGYLGYDHRTATEYGLLRTYVRAFIGRDNAGVYSPVLEYAFIQFGGLTVGRVTPVFEHGYNPAILLGGDAIGFYSDQAYVNSIGYTFSFGGGFSATIAADDAAEHRTAIVGGAYAGQSMPDIVAKLAYDASWGSVNLAGAVHQVRAAAATVSTKYGYAGQLAVKVNLPMMAKGSNVWASLNYAEGASRYTGYLPGAAVHDASFAVSDATVSGTSLRLTKTWGIYGGIQVYATPTVWVALAGGYSSHDPFGANNTVRSYQGSATVGWNPVAGFLIAGELGYAKLTGGTGAGGLVLVGNRKRDAFVGRIRFQRDF